MNKAWAGWVGALVAGTAMCLSGAAFAAGGGQGGTGGGNAHSAATAGLTHWGDPVTIPGGPMNGSMAAKKMDGTPAMDPSMMMPDDSKGMMNKAQ
jgi:hypothetical protein